VVRIEPQADRIAFERSSLDVPLIDVRVDLPVPAPFRESEYLVGARW
jgi:hypothetical protein